MEKGILGAFMALLLNFPLFAQLDFDIEIVCHTSDYCGHDFWDKEWVDIYIGDIINGVPNDSGYYHLTMELPTYTPYPSFKDANGYIDQDGTLIFSGMVAANGTEPIVSYRVDEVCTDNMWFGYDNYKLFLTLTDVDSNVVINEEHILTPLLTQPICASIPSNKFYYNAPDTLLVCGDSFINEDDICSGLYCYESNYNEWYYGLFSGEIPESVNTNLLTASCDTDSSDLLALVFLNANVLIENPEYLNLLDVVNQQDNEILRLGVFLKDWTGSSCEFISEGMDIVIVNQNKFGPEQTVAILEEDLPYTFPNGEVIEEVDFGEAYFVSMTETAYYESTDGSCDSVVNTILEIYPNSETFQLDFDVEFVCHTNEYCGHEIWDKSWIDIYVGDVMFQNALISPP